MDSISINSGLCCEEKKNERRTPGLKPCPPHYQLRHISPEMWPATFRVVVEVQVDGDWHAV